MPLAPLFSSASPSATPDPATTGSDDDDDDAPKACLGDAIPTRAPPAILEEFHRALEAFLFSSGSADASSTSSLLASLSDERKLERVRAMFRVSAPDAEEVEEDGGRVASTASEEDGLPFSWTEMGWDRWVVVFLSRDGLTLLLFMLVVVVVSHGLLTVSSIYVPYEQYDCNRSVLLWLCVVVVVVVVMAVVVMAVSHGRLAVSSIYLPYE